MTKTATTYRRFTADRRVIGGEKTMVITEIEGTTRHPMNWSDGSLSREGAWKRAQSQIHHTIVLTADGNQVDLGCVFVPEAFERAVYSGYISYGLSMTDGHYAPIDFESWVKFFRRDVLAIADRLLAVDYDPEQAYREQLFHYNDTSLWTCEGLQAYAHKLVQASK